MDFSKSIIINRLETMFHFQKISLPKGSRYHITTDEANGPVHSFDMEAPPGAMENYRCAKSARVDQKQ